MIDMRIIRKADPELAEAVEKELNRQKYNIELIASENFVSAEVLATAGTHLTNKYAEGYPGKRYYGGCEYVDVIETLAIDRVKQIFGAEHANVQPHSGSQANMAVYFAALEYGDKIMGMSLYHGGHLTHGNSVNISGKYFNIVSYGVDEKTGQINYEELMDMAKEHRPKMIVAGASAYPRIIDFRKFKEIADETGALLMVDMAHIAGLIAAGLHPSPVPYSDFVTSTTHKTLRGPRSGLILCKKEYANIIDKAIFPGTQGGPLMHIVAAKAVCFKEALTPEFNKYQKQIIRNAQVLAGALINKGFQLVSGGTDNHLMLVDLRNKRITGKEAEKLLDEVGITVNKNTIPRDPQSPFVTSGIRIGTPAVTTRGMKEEEMEQIAGLIAELIVKRDNITEIRQKVVKLCEGFPLYEREIIE